MAESYVQITEGGGKKLHTFQRTIGANTTEDEVTIIGEPYLASFVATAQVVTTTADSHLLQLLAGASLKVRIRRIELWQSAAATTVTVMDLVLLRLSTAGTGGGTITPVPLETTDTVSVTGMSLPTGKGTEGVTLARATPVMTQTFGASQQGTGPLVVWDFGQLRSKPVIIAAGTSNGIAISNNTAVAGGVVTIDVWFDESNF
jgi:hypothetical protein